MESLYADREGRKSSKPHETWLEFFKSNSNACCLHSLLSLIGFFSVICLFWQTLTSRDDTHTQEIRAKITSLDSIFFAGETSRALALSLTFTAGNINNLPLELSHLWKKLSSTCRQVYISKNISRLNLVKQFRTVHSPSQVHRFFGVGFFFYLFPPLRALLPQ